MLECKFFPLRHPGIPRRGKRLVRNIRDPDKNTDRLFSGKGFVLKKKKHFGPTLES